MKRLYQHGRQRIQQHFILRNLRERFSITVIDCGKHDVFILKHTLNELLQDDPVLRDDTKAGVVGNILREARPPLIQFVEHNFPGADPEIPREQAPPDYDNEGNIHDDFNI